MSSLNLAEIAPFDQLQPDQLRALQAQIQLRRCRLGQVLQTLEQPGQGLAVVLRGQCHWFSIAQRWRTSRKRAFGLVRRVVMKKWT